MSLISPSLFKGIATPIPIAPSVSLPESLYPL